MNPVGLMLNVCLCCIVNIHVLYKYEIDLIATDKCYCDVTLYSCGPKAEDHHSGVMALPLFAEDHQLWLCWLQE